MRAVRKVYGSTVVLAGIDLAVGEGGVHALLGPNGAGKTTTVGILATLTSADGGTAMVCGHDVSRSPALVRANIAVTGQFSAVDTVLTGRENLVMMARLGGSGRAAARTLAELSLERFDLTGAADRRVGTYSGGMTRRLDLAVSMLARPRVLFLDEPTTGLDPRSRQGVWDFVRELVADGVTVLLTTQYLQEADQLADRVSLLDHGRIVAEGTPTELKRGVGSDLLELEFADGGVETVATDGSFADLQRIVGAVDPTRPVLAHRLRTPTLDDVFLAVTGHPTGPGHPTDTVTRTPAGARTEAGAA